MVIKKLRAKDLAKPFGLKTPKEFTRGEIGEIYNALICLKDFVKKDTKEDINFDTYENVGALIHQLNRLENLQAYCEG